MVNFFKQIGKTFEKAVVNSPFIKKLGKQLEKEGLKFAKNALKEYRGVKLTPKIKEIIIAKVSKELEKKGNASPIPGGGAIGKLAGREAAKLAIKAFEASQK